MRRLLFCCGLAVLLGALPGMAGAQDRDVRPLLDRLDRLERDMNMMQRQVYRGGTSGAPAPVAPVDSTAMLNAENRMDQLETQMRTLTGQVEELNYNLDQVRRRLDRLVGDVDQRFGALEHGGAAPPATETAAAAPAASSRPTPTAGAAAASAGPAAASQSGTLTAPRSAAASNPAPAAQQQAAAPAAAAPGGLPAGSAQDQYNYAFGLLRQADYPAAEQALRAFVQRYPNDPLSGNAQYWLGETYYVRGDYNNAAAAFAEGYKRYPQSGKGPDNLLKLGMSLGNLGQKEQACASLNQIARDYPNASANIKERTANERRRYGC